MRAAFFLPDLRAGGAQHMVINMANEFAGRGHSVDLVLASAEGAFGPKIKSNVNTVVLGRGRVITTIPALRSYLKNKRPEIFLSALTHANLAAMIARTGLDIPTKFIVTERNFFSATNGNSGVASRFIMPLLKKIFYKKADKVVGISKGVTDDIVRVSGIPQDKAAWIHNPVVTPEMEAIVFPPKTANAVPVIITSGRLVEQKDHVTLLKAFAGLLQKRPAKLVMLGAGPLEGELKALAEALGISNSVDFKGYVESPWPHMAQADVFVISSRWEGFCNVIVEAMLAGLPVVSTDCPSGPAEILENGEYGTLVPVGDSDRLQAELLQMLESSADPARQRQRALAFSVGTICGQYENMFNNVLQARKRT